MENQVKTVATVNGSEILTIIESGQKYVPIKPICEALGIASNMQIEKIKQDPDLNSVGMLSISTATDGKQYEMFCLPYMFIFGWLFTINPKNVKEEAQEAVSKYRMECYRVLFEHYVLVSDFIEEKQAAIEQQMDYLDTIRTQFKTAKTRLESAQQAMKEVRKQTFEGWRANGNQLKLEFAEVVEG